MSRRWLAMIALVTSGCLSSTHVLPPGELQRLASLPPEQRGQRVRVVQGMGGAEDPPEAPRVGVGAVVIVDPLPRPYYGGYGYASRPSAKQSADEAKWWLVIAALTALGLAFTEGLRFDGWVQLHPMHPIHLYGPAGEWTWVPLAQLDPGAAAWARKAFVRPTEGPWVELERAPLNRVGFNYNLLLGTGEVPAFDGSRRAGFLSHIQLGYFPDQMLGVLIDIGLGWRTDGMRTDVFQSRFALEIQGLPLAARPIYAGVFGQVGAATRIEDIPGGYDRTSFLLSGGALLQLELTTRMALTARAGVALLDDDKALEATFGISIY